MSTGRGERSRARVSVASLVACAWLATVGACGPSDLLGPDAPQGIVGIALLGPLCPVQSLEDPCPDRPYQAWLEIRDAQGRPVTLLRTGEDGRFRVGLEPGTYTITPEEGDPFPTASEQDVEVEAGAYAEVIVLFDTGIRE